MPLRMREGLLEETFSVLRDHGAGRRECVVYLVAPRRISGIVDEALHPIHHCHEHHYEIDSDWLHRTWIDLARRGREIRVQVHTHGREAFHSKTDDCFPIVQTPGFLSLVIPDFATGPASLERAYLAELRDGGVWIERNPNEAIEVE